jgi:superfamily I DNA/RNA helicase
VLVPRKKLGRQFEQYATSRAGELPEQARVTFVQKPDFSPQEQRQLLLLSLHVNRESVLHARSFLGLKDEGHYAAEFAELKRHYGSLAVALSAGSATDFPAHRRRLRVLCGQIGELRTSLAAIDEGEALYSILERLIPSTDEELRQLREMFESLREDDDTLKSLHDKFLDFMRAVPADENTVRVMSLMASKGLDADHVYILGCNAGNIPGPNRSTVLSDHDHKEEQRRLLYVGFTRAKKTLTVSWSRYVPFEQALSSYTSGVGHVRIAGKLYTAVGLSEFLQHLSGVTWE